MISGHISIKWDEKIIKEQWDKFDDGLDDIADAVLAKSQQFVAVDQGMLKKSGHVESEYLHKIVEYDSPYAAYVEFGTSPHFPPIEPLVGWAHRVLGLDQQEAQAAAYAIARKIAAHGTDEQPFFRPAVDYTVPKIPELMRRHLR